MKITYIYIFIYTDVLRTFVHISFQEERLLSDLMLCQKQEEKERKEQEKQNLL